MLGFPVVLYSDSSLKFKISLLRKLRTSKMLQEHKLFISKISLKSKDILLNRTDLLIAIFFFCNVNYLKIDLFHLSIYLFDDHLVSVFDVKCTKKYTYIANASSTNLVTLPAHFHFLRLVHNVSFISIRSLIFTIIDPRNWYILRDIIIRGKLVE